jgi:2,4-dienoyl-CoA reductase-like NADH-dependent reductase (Old Yellow Enzyme family)
MTQTQYPNLFSEWQIRNTTIKNRVVFPPTCPTWVSDPWNGIFTDIATDYYEERARGGVGLIMIGDAIAPRGTYEALYEGHRQARKV